MKKFRCTVCGHIHEGYEAPGSCPLCKAGKDKFVEVTEAKAAANNSAAVNSSGKILMRNWKDEHRIGVAKGVDPWVIEQLNANFMAECVEVGMYIAMARQADREGFPEVSEAYRRIALEEADHASRFAELLGDVVHADTAKNLALRIDAEEDATACKFELAAKAKELGYDAIHDTVHEMCKDEARHGGAFSGLLQRYFNK